MLFFRYSLLVAGGGAIGALCRFWICEWMASHVGRLFPWGTLTVNILGSFLMGFLAIYFFEKVAFAIEWRSFLLVGFLGALTTFSTFSLDTFNLMASGKLLLALGNICVSVIVCLFAVGAGVWLAQWIQ